MQLVETDKGVMQELELELGLGLGVTQLLAGMVENRLILGPAPMEAMLQGMVETGRQEVVLVIPVMAKLEGMPRTVELLGETVKLVESLPMAVVGTVRMVVVMLRLEGRMAGMVKRAVMLRMEATTVETEVTMVEITAMVAITATVVTTAVMAATMVGMVATTQVTPTIPQTMQKS